MDPEPAAPDASPAESNAAWQRVQLARHPKRPHTLDYIERLFTDFQEIHGDRLFADDPAIVCGMGFFEGQPVMLVGEQKGRDTKQKLHRNFGMPKPEGYRKAIRVMQMAAKFNRPVITFLDTPGAYPGIDAEERGQAEAIARNLREMSRLATPVICSVHRRRRFGRRPGAGSRQPGVHAGERSLQRDFARELRRHHLARFGQSRAGGGGAAAHRRRSAAFRPDRRNHSGATGRRARRRGRRGGTGAQETPRRARRAGAGSRKASWWSSAT